MEYYIYCDESSTKGPCFSDFFGGCIIRADCLPVISQALNDRKLALGLTAEVKWTKTTSQYLDRYCDLMRFFFTFVRSGDIRVRIMFRKTSNQYAPADLPVKDERYFKLYYEFLKHAFGFAADQRVTGQYHVHILLDELPDHSASADAFKDYLCRLPAVLRDCGTGLNIRKRDIAEVRSHDHVLLQCVDIILGAMYFRLNKLHRAKEPGQTRRGKRTVAKEKLYQCILSEIRAIHPGFNPGISTGAHGRDNPHWASPYEHWEFRPYAKK